MNRVAIVRAVPLEQGTFDAGGPEIEALKKGAKFKAKLKMPTAVKKLSDEDRKALVGYLMAL